MANKDILCPVGHGKMVSKASRKKITFRNININYIEENFTCPSCKLEIATPEQIANTQKTISDAYRVKAGLLSGEAE